MKFNQIPKNQFMDSKREQAKENTEYESLKKMTDEEFIKNQKEELERNEKIRLEKNVSTIKDVKNNYNKNY